MKFTNTQRGPRGLNTLAGPVLVAPGETVDVEMAEAEASIAEATGWFEIVKPEPKAKPSAKAAEA